MAKNAVFYFSGTGNSLRIAKLVADSLENCEIWPMINLHTLKSGYERIGFVFPHYALGVPNFVRRWLETLDISSNSTAYFFAVETYGGFKGNCLAQVQMLLSEKNVRLQYGAVVLMFANNVTNYDMKDNALNCAAAADLTASRIALDIQQKKQTSIKRMRRLSYLIYKLIVSTYPKKGRGFNVSADCTGCGQCAKICPVANITMNDGKPAFGAHCEQCMACIQWCPKAAINYKNKTQKRKRYHHPSISLQEMMKK
jgi:ferredoxin